MLKKALAGTFFLIIVSVVALTAFAVSAPGSGARTPPGPHKFPWGTFTLAPQIAAKVRANQTLKIVMSAAETSSPIAPADYRLGLNRGASSDSKREGVKIKATEIGPVTTDPAQQIAQIEALLNGRAVDCLGINPVSEQAYVKIFAKAASMGVPVFAVNTDSRQAHRFAYYGLVEFQGAQQVGRAFLAWVKKTKTSVKKIVFLTGDPAAFWSQSRMRGFYSVVHAALPNVKFLDSPTKAVGTTFEQPKEFAAAQAYLQGHPDVDVVVDTDEGGSVVADVIKKLGLKGKTRVVMWNTFPAVFAGIKSGTIILSLDQALALQAETFEHACVNYLLHGKVAANPIQATPGTLVDSSNVVKAQALFNKTHPNYHG
jgi:ABC-type sugar transport system substrate-binding protein